MSVFTLSSCKKELVYECNLIDNAFIPFFGEEDYTINNVNIGKLNQCNDELDTLETSQTKINNLYNKVDAKNISVDPDISAIEAYFEYYSNSRMYPEDLVNYDIIDTYIGTMELAFIYEGFLQIDLFVDHYDSPIEGELNDFNLSDDFYKMRYYVNENYLYFVQYHNADATQFTVSRIYFSLDDNLIFDHLTYFKEGKSYNYKYTYYQEGIRGVQVTYRKYDDKKGILDIKDADFINRTIEEYQISNYINPMFKAHIVDPVSKTVLHYSQEQDKYMLSKEIYDNEGFIYGETFDNYEIVKYDFRFNIAKLNNWDYYFQEALYKNEIAMFNTNDEVFVNTIIRRGDFLEIYQHFEYVYHSTSKSYTLPNNLEFIPLSIEQETVLNKINKSYIDQYFLDKIDSNDVKEVELLDIWSSFVPLEFYEFIEENK
jgi:hypothetical protein